MVHIGIDNGVSGGIVALDDDGQIIAKHVMPVVKRLFRGKNTKFVDSHKLKDIIANIRGGDIAIVYLEFPTHSKNHNAFRSMTDSFSTTRTVSELLLMHVVEVEAKVWQKTFWTKPKGAKDYCTKAEALKVVRSKWKGMSWLSSDRCYKPHDGLVDACLIAEWGRNKEVKS